MIEELKVIFADYIDISKLDINENTVLSSDLEFSSLDFFDLINIIEEKYDVTMNDKELLNIKTVGDIVECLNKKL